MIGRRPLAEGKVLSGKWEFGCAQLIPQQDFHQCMKIHYKRDFGADLEFFYEHPFKKYFITEKEVPGLIFVAVASNPEDVKRYHSKTKHTEIQWIDPSAKKLPEEDCVPGFYETVEEATHLWQEHGNGPRA
jgi:hypothetical protein